MALKFKQTLGMILMLIISVSCNQPPASQRVSSEVDSQASTPTDDSSDTNMTGFIPELMSSDSAASLSRCELNEQTTDDSLSFPPLPAPPQEFSLPDGGTFTDLGVGYLGPLINVSVFLPSPDSSLSSSSNKSINYRDVSFVTFDWLKGLVLPLYSAPEGEILSWIACGWLVQQDQPNERKALAPALFYPGYSGFGFIVLAEQEDGWLNIRYTYPSNGEQGTAWVKTDQLQLSNISLAFMSWRDRYQAKIDEAATQENNSWAADWGYLYFRKENPPSLLNKPDEQSDAIAQIGDEHSMVPLAIEGDWMRVRVYQPSNYCSEGWQGTQHEGWVRWMDRQNGGNQLSEPYKGC